MNSSSRPSSTNGHTEEVDRESAGVESARLETESSTDPWVAIGQRWRELQEYAGYYVAANVDRLRLTSRAALMWIGLAAVGAIFGAGVVAAASVLLVVGIAGGLGELFSGRVWLGQLVVSAVILTLASSGVWLILNRQLKQFRRSMVKKYESRKQQERTEYGTDVAQRAAEQEEIS